MNSVSLLGRRPVVRRQHSQTWDESASWMRNRSNHQTVLPPSSPSPWTVCAADQTPLSNMLRSLQARTRLSVHHITTHLSCPMQTCDPAGPCSQNLWAGRTVAVSEGRAGVHCVPLLEVACEKQHGACLMGCWASGVLAWVWLQLSYGGGGP